MVIALVACSALQAHAADVNVGPGRALKTLQAGVAAARANDRVVLDEGIYLDNVATIDKPLTIEGAGRGATLRVTKPISNRKGILVVNADVTTRKITFEGARVTNSDGRNGAGIRHQAGRLAVDTCVFNNNQNGILANANANASVTIRGSTFSDNGAGDGYTHGIYINAIAQLTVSDSTFTGTKVGHDIKSRAYKTTITNTILDDGVTGTPSYAIDLPNGGDVVLSGVKITQGLRTSNRTMVAYGAEKSLHPVSKLTVTGSTFVSYASAAIAINNFSSITAALSNNTFQNITQITKGLARTSTNLSPSLREGAIFSGADSNAISYLRFHNTGTAPGNASVSLYDSRDGRFLGTWVSPQIPPNADPQYSIRILEDALRIQDRPQTYSAVISSGMAGTFQHVLHRAGSGVLTNLSTCAVGVARALTQIGGVHTSNLDSGYPASIVVQNRGATPGSAQIGIYDARDGRRIGLFTTPEVPVDGDLFLPVREIEAAAGVSPTWEMGHWVLKIENEFSGALQQLIANEGAGAITDMTTVCALNAESATDGGGTGAGVIFPASSEFESMLRVYNTGRTAAPVRVGIFDAATGARIGQWDGPWIAPDSSRQFSVSSMMPRFPGDAPPRFLRVAIESEFQGFVQHVLRHPARDTITNLSTCDAGTTASGRAVAGLRASAVEPEGIIRLVIYNTGATAAGADLAVFDALDGRDLGHFTTQAMPAGGTITLSVADLEVGLGLSGESGIGAYNVRLGETFDGLMQYLLVSSQTGTVSDMTTACAVGPSAD